MQTEDEKIEKENARFQRRLFGVAVGTFFVPLFLVFGLIAWRDYSEGDWDGMIFVLLLPALMLLGYCKDRFVERLTRTNWFPTSRFWRGMALDFIDKSTFLLLVILLALWQEPITIALLKCFAAVFVFFPVFYTIIYGLHLRFPRVYGLRAMISLRD